MARSKKRLAVLASLAFWIAVWQVAAMLVAKEVILPAPLAVFRRFIALLGTGAMWKATALSLLRILGGYCGGLVLGVALGAGMYFFPPVCVLMKPFLTVVRSTPVASFILIAYFIITDTAIPLFITLLMVLPMIASTVFTALGSTDRTLLEMASVYRFSFGKTLRHIYLPTVRPHLMGQALAALGFGWKAGIAAEVLCTPRDSIGKYLYDAKVYLDSVDTFAYTLAIVLISLALEKGLRLLAARKGATV